MQTLESEERLKTLSKLDKIYQDTKELNSHKTKKLVSKILFILQTSSSCLENRIVHTDENGNRIKYL